MSAPDFPTLYQFEDTLEEAARSILAANGVNALIQRSEETRTLPVVGLQLQVGKVTGHKVPRVTDGKLFYDAYEAQMTATIFTDRTVSNPSHRGLVAIVRSLLGDPARWTVGLLPYHTVTDIRESGTSPSIEVDEDLDVSQVAFDVVLNIRQDALPATP